MIPADSFGGLEQLRPPLERSPAISQLTSGNRPDSASVITCQDFPAPPESVWEALMFYEEVKQSLPWILRPLLPAPLGTEGCKARVGNEIKCRYARGHLLKRVTHITRGRSYSFEVLEQGLALRGGIKLLGGSYTLHNLPGDRTRVALTTQYQSANCPRWFYRQVEQVVCHFFHRHILAAMQIKVRRVDL